VVVLVLMNAVSQLLVAIGWIFSFFRTTDDV
jgi:hypothetical protein